MAKVQTICALVVVFVLGMGFVHALAQQEQLVKSTTSEKASQGLVNRAMTVEAGVDVPTPPPGTAPTTGSREVAALSLEPGDYGCDTQDVSYRIGPGSTPTSTRALLVSDKNLIMGGYEFTCSGIGCTADYNGGLVATLVKTGVDTFELTELKFGAKTAHLCTKRN